VGVWGTECQQLMITLPVHVEGLGLPGIVLESHQNEITTVEEDANYAARLADFYRRIEAEMLLLILIVKDTKEGISKSRSRFGERAAMEGRARMQSKQENYAMQFLGRHPDFYDRESGPIRLNMSNGLHGYQ